MSIRALTDVWKYSRHGGSHLLLLLAIADYASDEGEAYPSISTLATKCRMSGRNVNYLLAALEEAGELKIRKGTGPRGTNRYVLDIGGMKAASPLKQSSPLNCASGEGCKGLQEGGEEAFPLTLKPASSKPSLNRQQEPSENPVADRPAARSPGKRPKGSLPKKPQTPGKTVPTRKAYEDAYEVRYGAKPISNGTTNGQLSKFVESIGADDAPKVAEFYLRIEDRYYQQKMHPVGLLLQDCSKIHTMWKSGRTTAELNAQEQLERRNRAVGEAWLSRQERTVEALAPGVAARRRVFDGADYLGNLGPNGEVML